VFVNSRADTRRHHHRHYHLALLIRLLTRLLLVRSVSVAVTFGVHLEPFERRLTRVTRLSACDVAVGHHLFRLSHSVSLVHRRLPQVSRRFN
jgi:hypothetical protein